MENRGCDLQEETYRWLRLSLPTDDAGANEALDCRLYARAAAWIAGADGQTECGNLEQQINAQELTEPNGATQMVGVIRRSSKTLARRVFRSSYLG